MTLPTSPQGWPAPPPQEPPSRDWSGLEPMSFAWGRIKADLFGVVAPLFTAFLLILLPTVIFSGAQVARVAGEIAKGRAPDPLDPTTLALQGASIVVGWFVQGFVQGGLYRFALATARGEKPGFGVAFSGGRHYFASLVYSIVAGLPFLPIAFVQPAMHAIGAPPAASSTLALTLFVPAYAVWMLLGLTMPAIVDRNLGGFAALGESIRLTAGHRGEIALNGLLLFVLSFPATCACCLGTPIAFAMVPLTLSFMYLKATGQRVAGE